MDKKDISHHISQRYNQELEDIRNDVLKMGGLVEQQLADAIASLVKGDSELGGKVVSSDWKVNAMEVGLDEECTHILARRQPTASDLRLVIAVIKTITDLERIGDEAERIGRMALRLVVPGAYKPVMAEMDALGQRVRTMLRGALDALARMDVEQALKVAEEDVHADSEYKAIMNSLTEQMMREPQAVPQLLDIMWAARALERIGDRSGNICEYVIYLVRGKDVRHTSFEQMAESARPSKPGK